VITEMVKHRWENNNKIDMALHRDQWQAFVNMVIKLLVP
jgi:hypothetical protein